MQYFSKNIRHLRKIKGFTQEYLAEELSVPRSRISSYEEERSNPSIEFIIAVSEYFKVPIDILLKNDLTKSKDVTFIEIGSKRVLFPVIVNDDNEDKIEVVPIEASAGYLKGYDDPEYIEDLKRFSLPFLPTGKYRAFPIKGDSMLPQKSGSFIVGEYVEQLNDVKDGATYVVISKDGMTYKQVYYNAEENALNLVSYNKAYEPYNVPLEDVHELWKFRCSINLEEYQEDELKISSILNMLTSLGIELQSLQKG